MAATFATFEVNTSSKVWPIQKQRTFTSLASTCAYAVRFDQRDIIGLLTLPETPYFFHNVFH